MNKRVRRLAALSGVVCLVLAAACGGDDDASDVTTPEPPAETDDGEDDVSGDAGESEDETGAASLEGQTILLGLTTSLSGEAAGAGRSISNATQLAIDEINESGGIHGAMLELRVEDTQFDPSQEIPAVQKLIDQDGVHVMVGPIPGRSVNAGAPIALDAGIITVSAHASEGGLEELGEEMLYVAATEPFLAAQTAQHLLDEYSPSTAVLTWDDGETFAQRSAEAYRSAFLDAGVEILDEIRFEAGAADFSSVEAAVAAANPDVVTIAAFPEIQATITAGVRNRGFDGPIGCASNGCNTVDFPTVAGEAANGAYSTLGFDPASDAAVRVEEAYVAAFPDDPFTAFVVNQYDAVYILATALRAVDPYELLIDGRINVDAVLDVVATGWVVIDGARGRQTLTPERTVAFEDTATYEWVVSGSDFEQRVVRP